MSVHADSAELIAANAQLADLQRQIAAMKKQLPAEVPPDRKPLFRAAQASWEKVAQLHGDAQTRPPLVGESHADYLRALAAPYTKHSKPWSSVDLYQVPDAMLDVVIDQVRADALVAAKNPPVTPGVLTVREERNDAGTLIRRFYGDIGVMLDLSRNQRRYVTGFPTIHNAYPS